jgi:hypothetical protein
MTDKLTVQEAWAAVMADVQSLGKNQRSSQLNFSFRGIDDVMNAVGPVLRKHGVMVIPTKASASHRDVVTSNGKAQREATVIVSYTIYGPAGDSMPGESAGESADSGDKSTPQAMSVAYRTFLLQSLTLPTQQPDPDQHVMERAAPSRGKSAADEDPLLVAKNAVHAAWLSRHQRFSRDEMKSDFEQWASVPLDDADAEVLTQYAKHIREEGSSGEA